MQVTESGSQTLFDVNGLGVLWLLAIPLVLVALPMAFRQPHRRRVGIACGIVMLALAFLGSASIGLYYYPTALGLLLAAVARDG